jgi:hypothetical protein
MIQASEPTEEPPPKPPLASASTQPASPEKIINTNPDDSNLVRQELIKMMGEPIKDSPNVSQKQEIVEPKTVSLSPVEEPVAPAMIDINQSPSIVSESDSNKVTENPIEEMTKTETPVEPIKPDLKVLPGNETELKPEPVVTKETVQPVKDLYDKKVEAEPIKPDFISTPPVTADKIRLPESTTTQVSIEEPAMPEELPQNPRQKQPTEAPVLDVQEIPVAPIETKTLPIEPINTPEPGFIGNYSSDLEVNPLIPSAGVEIPKDKTPTNFEKNIKEIDTLGASGVLLDILDDSAIDKQNQEKVEALEVAENLIGDIPFTLHRPKETTKNAKAKINILKDNIVNPISNPEIEPTVELDDLPTSIETAAEDLKIESTQNDKSQPKTNDALVDEKTYNINKNNEIKTAALKNYFSSILKPEK